MTERPAPSASGSFEKTPLSHVLTYLHDKKLTGSVEIVSDGRTDLVHAQGGFPARVRLAEPVDPLGRVLLEMGLIDQAALDASLRDLGEGKGLQGRILIKLGLLDLPGLVRGLREQLRRKLVRLFEIREATYSYFDGANLLLSYGGEESVRMDPYPIILAGVRHSYRDDRLAPILKRVVGRAIKAAPGAEAPKRFDLAEDELRLFSFVQEAPRTLEEILAARFLPEHHAKALCYCLVLTHQVEVVAVEPHVSPPAASAPAPRTTPEAAKLPPLPRAGAIESPPPTAPGPSVKQPTPSAPRLPAAGRRPSRPDVPEAPPDAPPELLATREEIIARAEALDTQDYFLMLGATHEDPEEVLRAKYFELAKKYHPDRLPPALQDLRETLDFVFANLTEAYTTLTDVEMRRRYLDLLREGSGTPADARKIQSIVDSAMNLQKAEVCIRRRNYDEAEKYCRLAMEGNPDDGEAIALLAWILLHRLEPGQGLGGVLELLRKAVALSPDSEKVNFYMGTALKRDGDSFSAITYFRKAATLNPRNLDAIREVRLFEMRKEKHSVPAKTGKKKTGGLLDRIFGKK